MGKNRQRYYKREWTQHAKTYFVTWFRKLPYPKPAMLSVTAEEDAAFPPAQRPRDPVPGLSRDQNQRWHRQLRLQRLAGQREQRLVVPRLASGQVVDALRVGVESVALSSA